MREKFSPISLRPSVSNHQEQIAGENPGALEQTGLDVRSHAPGFNGEVEGSQGFRGSKKDRPCDFEVDQICANTCDAGGEQP